GLGAGAREHQPASGSGGSRVPRRDHALGRLRRAYGGRGRAASGPHDERFGRWRRPERRAAGETALFRCLGVLLGSLGHRPDDRLPAPRPQKPDDPTSGWTTPAADVELGRARPSEPRRGRAVAAANTTVRTCTY